MSGTNTTMRPSIVDTVEESGSNEADPAALFEALDDDDCRAIIRATSAEPKSASELSETCNIPLSTTYRKIELLEEACLLSESIQINSNGGHASTYATVVGDVHLSITNCGDVEVEVEVQSSRTDSAATLSLDD